MSAQLWALPIAFIGFTSIGAAAADDSGLPVKIGAMDANIRYVGRFDNRDPAGPRCAWSNSAVRLKFSGTALNVKLADTPENQWQVTIDGKPAPLIKSKGPSAVYPVAAGLAEGEHTVELVK